MWTWTLNKTNHCTGQMLCLMDRLLLSVQLFVRFAQNPNIPSVLCVFYVIRRIVKFDLENHIEKTDYENQTIDFMLCLFTVDLKEFDHQCLLRFSVLFTVFAHFLSFFFFFQIDFVSVRSDFSIVTLRNCCVWNQWKNNLPSIHLFVGFVGVVWLN